MVGIKHANPGAVSVAYVGDGGAYAIDLGSSVNAAIRNEKIFVIVVNNAVYGMTGGPTTVPGVITDTTRYGADKHSIKGPQLIRNVNQTAWIARGITSRQLELRELMREALQFTMVGKGFAFLEVLSSCTLNLGDDRTA
jgi:2-oxoglutarate/2-oxoacid ferredoxin oxidoreductase subunit beta